MSRCLLASIAVLSLAASLSAQDKTPRHAMYPRWITDYAAARNSARADGKPLLVVLRCEP